jgi:hypothetical protein
MIHSDLPHANFILGSCFQNCAWQAYVIVEVPFGLGDPKSSREHRSGEILRAGLAVAAGDCEDFQRERLSVVGCQRLIGLQRIARTQNYEITLASTKSWPSKFSPRNATNNSPGLIVRESVLTLLTMTVPSPDDSDAPANCAI